MISAKFFQLKERSKGIQFNPNKVLELYLELAYNWYAEILRCLEDMEDEPVCLLYLHTDWSFSNAGIIIIYIRWWRPRP